MAKASDTFSVVSTEATLDVLSLDALSEAPTADDEEAPLDQHEVENVDMLVTTLAACIMPHATSSKIVEYHFQRLRLVVSDRSVVLHAACNLRQRRTRVL